MFFRVSLLLIILKHSIYQNFVMLVVIFKSLFSGILLHDHSCRRALKYSSIRSFVRLLKALNSKVQAEHFTLWLWSSFLCMFLYNIEVIFSINTDRECFQRSKHCLAMKFQCRLLKHHHWRRDVFCPDSFQNDYQDICCTGRWNSLLTARLRHA